MFITFINYNKTYILFLKYYTYTIKRLTTLLKKTLIFTLAHPKTDYLASINPYSHKQVI
jgi:hypothetical protein